MGKYFFDFIKDLKIRLIARKAFVMIIALFIPYVHGVEISAQTKHVISAPGQITLKYEDDDFYPSAMGLRLFSDQSNDCGSYDVQMKNVKETQASATYKDGKIDNLNGWGINGSYYETPIDPIPSNTVIQLQATLENTTKKEITTYIGTYIFLISKHIYKSDDKKCIAGDKIIIPAQSTCHVTVDNNINVTLNQNGENDIKSLLVSNASDDASVTIVPNKAESGMGVLSDGNGHDFPAYTLSNDAKWLDNSWTWIAKSATSNKVYLLFPHLKNKSVLPGKYTGTATVTLTCD